MGFSTFQKLTMASCVVLCVALLLPKMLLSRGKRDAPNHDGPAGHFPPMTHRVPLSEDQRRSSRPHNPEAIARAKGAGAGATAGKSNLAGQIIPIYGFGILLYILYILFKITSKGKTTKPPESRFTAVRSENTKRKITDFELAQLQDRLNETKDMIERIITTASVGSDSAAGGVALDEEQKLLFQLQEITRVMQEGRLVDDLPDSGVSEHFCCVHSPDTPMEESGCREQSGPDEGEEDQTDDSRNTSQSQPETDSHMGSDVTPGPEAGLRRRIKQ